MEHHTRWQYQVHTNNSQIHYITRLQYQVHTNNIQAQKHTDYNSKFIEPHKSTPKAQVAQKVASVLMFPVQASGP